MNVFSKELLNAGGLNNIAIRFFQAVIAIGTVLVIFADLLGADNITGYLADNYIQIVVIIQLVFSFLIFGLGEPTAKGWETDQLHSKIKNSSYGKLIRNIDEVPEVIDVLKTYFSKNWIYLWGAWAIFYLVLLIRLSFPYIPETNEDPNLTRYFQSASPPMLFLNILETALNLLSTYFQILLFLILSFKTDLILKKKDRKINFHKARKRYMFIFLAILVAQAITYLAIHASINISGLPYDSTEYIQFLDNIERITFISQVIVGLFACVCLALLVDRLIGSITTILKYKTTLILPFLYLYCAIQPYYPFLFEKEYKEITIFILIVALIGKYLLYLIVTALYNGRWILFHFIETAELFGGIQNKRKPFHEIWEPENLNSDDSNLNE